MTDPNTHQAAGEVLTSGPEPFTPLELEAIEYLAMEWLDYQDGLDRQGDGRELFGGMLVESVQRKAKVLQRPQGS